MTIAIEMTASINCCHIKWSQANPIADAAIAARHTSHATQTTVDRQATGALPWASLAGLCVGF